MRSVQPDDNLAAVVASQPQSRPELTKKLWNYTKKRALQDKKENVMVTADDHLNLSFRRLLPAQPVPNSCKPVNAQLDGQLFPCAESPVGFCAVGTITSGFLKGTKEAVYQAISLAAGMPTAEASTTLSYSATQVFHTVHGDLYMSVVGVVDNERKVFTELGRITGGTGRFTNATGNLFISGTLSADGISFYSNVSGEICLARPMSR